MEWLAENAQNGYFLLGFAAFMLAGVWWIQKQALYLVGAGVALVALLAFWLVIRNVPTAEAAIRTDLDALAAAVVAKDHDAAAKYVAEKFSYRRKNAEKWLANLDELLDENSIDALNITDFKLKKRAGDEAHVTFHVGAFAKKKSVHTVVFRDCELVRDGGVWQIAKVSLSKAKDDD